MSIIKGSTKNLYPLSQITSARDLKNQALYLIKQNLLYNNKTNNETKVTEGIINSDILEKVLNKFQTASEKFYDLMLSNLCMVLLLPR